MALMSRSQDMLYAVIARPPAYGAKPVSFDQKAAEGVKGVRQRRPDPNGYCRMRGNHWMRRGKVEDALKVQWDKGTHPQNG